MYTTLVGLPLSEIDTPALLIDLDALEHNIRTMASDIKSRGADWRPHSKANKTPQIVHMEIAAGAIGVTCAKLGEAEVMAANGIKDILISNQVVGKIKTRRIAALVRHVDVKSAVDSRDNVIELNAAGAEIGSKPRVVIEVNTGMERCGVAPGEATLDLARFIVDQPNLEFAGLMTWEGHSLGIKDPAEREKEIKRACGSLVETAELLRANGIPVGIVSAGGTGTYLTSAGVEGITEVEAGGGIFGDSSYIDLGANVKPALSVMTHVTSRPSRDKVVIDSGRKTIDPSNRQPTVVGLEIDGPIAFSAEHGKFTLKAPSDTPKVADRLFLQSGYSDQLCHLHEYFIGVRNGVVEAVWPILGRGKLQ
ncbi:MAG: DSD1 family PLP-dependent enzyme [Chloroflexota bacterium]|nr:DSD1 family PLP-dependent enzyme [Chloroflexota bacterium]